MKTKIGLSLGLALTLVAGVFATMLALGLFSTQQVQAAPGGVISAVTVDLDKKTTGDTEVTATVNFTTGMEVTKASGKITIDIGTLTKNPTKYVPNDVKLALAATPTVAISAGVTGTDAGAEVILAPGANLAAGAYVVTIPGLDNPATAGNVSVSVKTTVETAVTGTVTVMAPPPVPVTGVSVVHAPEGVGEPAKVTVSFTTTKALLAASGTITIEFEDDVQMPAVLNESDVTIVGIDYGEDRLEGSDGSGGPDGVVGTGDDDVVGTTDVNRVASPLDVTVQLVGTPADEPSVTLTIPDMDPTDDRVAGIDPGPVTVIFRQSAGIKNPTEQGTWNVKVKTSEDTETTSDDPVSLKTYRTISLNAKSGTRGKTVTATGRGFKNSTTATVFLDSGTIGEKEDNETVLCDAVVGGDDTFSCSFTANVPPFGSSNLINAVDGREGYAKAGAPWTLDPKIVAIPDAAAIGDTVTVELTDFTPGDQSTGFDIGGANILTTAGAQMVVNIGTTGTTTTTITIPNGVALGKQALRIKLLNPSGKTGSYRDTMTIGGAQLEVTPSTVVPNQSVTITGRGFTGNAVINEAKPDAKILIGGTQITDWDKIDSGETIDIDSGGSWVATVVIPVSANTTSPGTFELKVIDSEGRPGVTEITIPARTIDFDPKESRVGTLVTVSGAGWLASNTAEGAESGNIDVTYTAGDEDTESRATPDSDGNFSATVQVPLNAQIPSTNKVTVDYTVKGETVTETVSHRVPGASIEISPNSGPGGTVVTLTGSGFKAFTTMSELEVGTVTVAARPSNPNADRNGNLPSIEVLIPALNPGTLTVKAKVGDATVSVPFTLTADDAPAAPVGDMAPADAFMSLGDSLVDVYKWIGATQEWQSFVSDPAFAAFNTLETVSSGDALWVRVTADGTYNGKPLYTGWNQVVLP